MTDAEPLEENRQFRGGRSAAKLPLYNVCDAQSVKCDWLFTLKEISNHRLDCSDMTTAELDLVILAKLDALVNNSAETSVNKKKDHVMWVEHGSVATAISTIMVKSMPLVLSVCQ